MNAPSARYCQQCAQNLLGPAGGKGVPAADPAYPGQQYPGPGGGQYPQRQGGPPWGQAAAGGLVGFVLGSL
ncbi:MAG: hypothetical protein M3069_13455, partial [Chloroflexota bacterium]|nr:hypothetical protein [Chloroflexota bacterium]